MYKDFYFLHIHKTGGRYFKKYIISQLENSINIISKNERHSGWIEDIKEDTYVFLILRDPIEFICSFYSHIVSQKAGLLEENNIEFIKNNIVSINLDKKYMFKWLKANPWSYNLQSKQILNTASDNKSIIDNIVQKYTFNNNVDKDLLYKRLDRSNLIIKQISLLEPKKIIEKICKDFNINFEGEIKIDTNTFSNMASKTLYNSLTEADKAIIEQMFAIDLEIYNSNIFTQLD